ncbi:MAG: DUF1837 domain-containing protein [Deltaproteobacteria bacterium]|nr:DUF1837 domain-containing protein [Deltaproteobacteria bacterium]
MNGIRYTHTTAGCHLIIIDTLSDDLKDCIRKRLSEICFGSVIIQTPSRHSDYRSTITAFFERYDDKTSRQKKGIIGELLTHVLVREYLESLQPASILFNKEERSMRKGFDLVFFKSLDETVWYCEVKSGGLVRRNQAPTARTLTLLSTACTDLMNKLEKGPQSIWDSVVFDSNLTVDEAVRPLLRRVLDDDAPSVRDNDFTAAAILVSVVYASPAIEVVYDDVVGYHEEASCEELFDDLIVISVQKETISRVEEFLRGELD